ncbi:pilus assembly protein PilP [Uliginosibacterium sp. H3]|uniref:Pilus assembly protein PilP n=1 Tax=Uliginosibacterium silvisoli TaxID=3114758 RepID=A0ABU6JZD2_9RHOO|nr:pilus assembly protein PilP [Uliginosibacterium sp. H3]
MLKCHSSFGGGLAVLTLALLLSACGADEHQDIKNWMQAEQANMRGRVPPLPQLKTFAVVDFDSATVGDPFLASKLDPEKRGAGANRPDTNRRREPLEAYPLESLKLVGMMISKDGKPVALVQADKTIYQIRTGNYIGQNFGLVTKISETELALKELIEDANGDWVERMGTMQLQEQEAKR